MAEIKPAEFVGSAREDLGAFPDRVRYDIGHAIFLAQIGMKSPKAKPLKGSDFKGAGVLEIVESFEGDACRAAYTVRFQGAVYVLHAFQKKSTAGIATPRREIELIKRRLQAARLHYESNHAGNDNLRH